MYHIRDHRRPQPYVICATTRTQAGGKTVRRGCLLLAHCCSYSPQRSQFRLRVLSATSVTSRWLASWEYLGQYQPLVFHFTSKTHCSVSTAEHAYSWILLVFYTLIPGLGFSKIPKAEFICKNQIRKLTKSIEPPNSNLKNVHPPLPTIPALIHGFSSGITKLTWREKNIKNELNPQNE